MSSIPAPPSLPPWDQLVVVIVPLPPARRPGFGVIVVVVKVHSETIEIRHVAHTRRWRGGGGKWNDVTLRALSNKKMREE